MRIPFFWKKVADESCLGCEGLFAPQGADGGHHDTQAEVAPPAKPTPKKDIEQPIDPETLRKSGAI